MYPGGAALSDHQFNGLADFYIARPVEFAGFPALARAWQAGPVLAIVPNESLPRLPKPAPHVLAQTDSGLTLIANFSLPRAARMPGPSRP